MLLRKLLQKLRGESACALVVEGVITEVGRHTPRTHLGPHRGAEEAYFDVQIGHAELTDGRKQDPSAIIPSEFSGKLALLEQFAIGDKVRITTTTATGRLIETMEAID